jgi:hypothetical protein
LSEINEISNPLQPEAIGPASGNGYAELDPARGVHARRSNEIGVTNLEGQAACHNEAASCRALTNFLCIDLFAGRADEHELFQTRSKCWDRPEVLHGVATREAY